MKERLQKLISAAGLMSRRAAEEEIAAGHVLVNGETARLGDRADPETDAIVINGRPLPRREKKLYIMLNKPKGTVTTLRDEKGRRNVTELVKDLGTRVYPAGRLDMYSEGLLVLTNDGEFANRLTHPSANFGKTYHTWVQGEQIEEKLPLLRRPMELDGAVTRPAQAEILARFDRGAVLEITIFEGKNRQIRRMCEQAGLKVTRLLRVREGPLELGELKSGAWRPLTEDEIRQVLS